MGWAQRLPLIGWLGNGRYRKVRGSIGNWETRMKLYWGFKGAGALPNFHNKVAASVGDYLDQGGILKR